MKLRLTGWLAALLVMSAVFGIPVTRVATNRTVCFQVYCEQREDRLEQAADSPAPAHPRSLWNAPLPESIVVRLLDYSLFQRPPPTFSI